MGHDAKEFHPVTIIRQGDLSASIYRAVGSRGPFYRAVVSRVGTNNGRLCVTDHYLEQHLLPLSNLATRAFNKIADLKARDTGF